MARKAVRIIVKDPRERKPVGDLGQDRDGYGRPLEQGSPAMAIKLAFQK
jgi:hypothetical protein